MGEILVKTGEEYILYSKDKTVLGITSGTIEGRKLSKQNCEDIERGYDLENLSRERLSTRFDENSGYHKFVFVEAYKEGFLKAMEILGDKMYTESHMAYMMAKTCEFVENHLDRISSVEFFNNTIKSLQPKEWDVEICCYIGNGDKESDSFKDPLVTNTGIPKLDSDGCLILRRK